jgi:hypothetical protein
LSKLKLDFWSIFDRIFFTGSDETIFWGVQNKFSALTDERFPNFGRSKHPKRGILAIFWVKIETNLLSIYDGIFLQEVMKLKQHISALKEMPF